MLSSIDKLILAGILMFLIFKCGSEDNQKKSNEVLEKLLNNIENSTPITEVKEKLKNKVNVNWNNFNKYESDCGNYKIIIDVDTFDYNYYLDFCNNKFNWWDKSEKR